MGTTRIQTRQGNAAGLKKLLEQIAASLRMEQNSYETQAAFVIGGELGISINIYKTGGEL